MKFQGLVHEVSDEPFRALISGHTEFIAISGKLPFVKLLTSGTRGRKAEERLGFSGRKAAADLPCALPAIARITESDYAHLV
ncbi:hypothetical protein C7I84_06380 [Mesorhizobium ephedrae]|uniref:Uncharacterized protein n=1 Tax=Kumtagia ephedrae TaxID=2116701 RepID=A0A2P7SL92_9HYPH|nr:hypothetical protein C7I84_06380 [Mesorhizobium ephedrae]